jgi:Bacterial Ig domain
MPIRFYRIVDEGADTASDEPSVSITSPTSGTTNSGEMTITVIASTDQPVLSWTKLYVDGQEMQMADSTTNYTDSTGVTNYEADTYSINTCEWGNGAHTLFATAKCASGFGDALNAPTVLFGHAVSPFVPATFANLVTRISFSQPFFDPAMGQTQQVSAVFAANADWTLNIVDASSNVVLTTTGSGTSMQYGWDGNGNGETNLPAGIYYYLISAETNGLAPLALVGGGSPFSLSSASLSKELYAIPTNGEGGVAPLAIYPQGFDTNTLTIFKATQAEVDSLYSDDTESDVTTDSGVSPDDASSPSSQNSPASPQRPSNRPVRGIVGKFGVAYQEYTPTLALSTPLNGFPVLPGQPGQHVQLQGSSGTSCTFPTLESVSVENFITQIQRGAWQPGFIKANSQLLASDLIGSGTPFNQVSLGLLTLHGAYGTSIDYNANHAEQVYFPIDGRPNTSSSWVSASQMNFGGAGTNGLKWMALLACNSLRQANWNSMQSAGVTPFNGNLHLLLGADSICDNGNLVLWAKFMLGLDLNTPRPIMQAWYDSGASCVHPPVTFAVVGFDDCEADMLIGTNSTTPGGDIFYDSKVVKP